MDSAVTIVDSGNITLKVDQNINARNTSNSAVLHRNLHDIPAKVVSANGKYLYLENGRKTFDATGGAAVACIDHGNEAVKAAVACQTDELSYCSLFSSSGAENPAKGLVDSTKGAMARAFCKFG